MAVLEMQSPSTPAVRWTEICATEHTSEIRPTPGRVVPGSRAGATVVDRTDARVLSTGRRERLRTEPVGPVHACRVQAPVRGGVVDDVPTWALLACGVVFGLVLLLALALMGGPAYA